MYFKVIFYLCYNFYLKVFREKLVPEYFAAILTAIIAASIYSNIFTILFLISKSNFAYLLSDLAKFVSLGLALFGVAYVSRKKRYTDCLKTVESQYPKGKKRVAILILYGTLSCLSMVMVFYLSEFVREINLRGL